MISACAFNQAPARPERVPKSAVWAGGPDGGAWIDCRPAAKEPYLQYDCTIYYESGTIWSSGAFVVAEGRAGAYRFPSGAFPPVRISQYVDYDGRRVFVRDGGLLLPRGWIEHPSGDGHGKRERYELGELVQTEEY